MNEAEAIFFAVRVWAIIGAVAAAVFLTIGIDRIDEDARGAYVFRPLLVPAVLLIWPLVLWRWWVLETDRDNWAKRYDPPRKTHAPVAYVLPVAIVLIVATGLLQRQVWPADIAPEQLVPAEAAE